jgi:hypothetical protein
MNYLQLSMTQQQDSSKRYWIGAATCCFVMTALMVLTLISSQPRRSAALTTAAFILIFLISAILYLMRWRPVIKVMIFVIAAFYVLVGAYWLQTGQIIGPLPLATSVLLIWQNGKLYSAKPSAVV